MNKLKVFLVKNTIYYQVLNIVIYSTVKENIPFERITAF